MINKYGIVDKNTCYDEVRRNILKAIQKIEIKKNFKNFSKKRTLASVPVVYRSEGR